MNVAIRLNAARCLYQVQIDFQDAPTESLWICALETAAALLRDGLITPRQLTVPALVVPTLARLDIFVGGVGEEGEAENALDLKRRLEDVVPRMVQRLGFT